MTEFDQVVNCTCGDGCACEGICPCADCVAEHPELALSKETAALVEEFSYRTLG